MAPQVNGGGDAGGGKRKSDMDDQSDVSHGRSLLLGRAHTVLERGAGPSPCAEEQAAEVFQGIAYGYINTISLAPTREPDRRGNRQGAHI